MMDNTVNNRTSQRNLFFKMGFIAILIILLMIPTVLIQEMVQDRTALQKQVGADVAASWGNEQLVQGPVLCIPFKKRERVGNQITNEQHYCFISPENVKIASDVTSEVRTKGIFNTVVYTTANQMTGSFSLDALPQKPEYTYQWDEAAIIVGLTDPTAISDLSTTMVNEQPLKTFPGTKYTGFAAAGFHTPVTLRADQKTLRFNQPFSVRGSGGLRFMPTARETDIDVSSNWPHPSFVGRLLPQSHEVNGTGFRAHWDANEYNRPLPAVWFDNEQAAVLSRNDLGFGMNFIETADHYQKTDRSTKYAILVILLSFTVFFFYEVMMKIRIHPIQYMMIGFSLVIFYALLLSFTEHIGFNMAYWISSGAVVSLIAVYAFAILKKLRLIFVLVLLFGALYAYIFVLLQLEDYALLAGTIGLFLILATVMLMSRKVDWYSMME